RDVADIALRVGVQVAIEGEGGDGARVALLLLDAGQALLLELSELRVRKRRLVEDLGDQPQHGREVLARRLNRRAGRDRAAEDERPGLEPIQLVVDLLARVPGGP